MKILIYGAGVLGSLYGARLREAGHDVALLARGNRLLALRSNGVILHDLVAERRTVTRLDIVNRLRPDDEYDVAIVSVRLDHIRDALPELSVARHIRSVLFMHNHAGGSDNLIAAVGRERIFLGFPGASGFLDGDIVKYSLIPQQPTTLGEAEGRPTVHLREIAGALREGGFAVVLS